MPDHGNSDSEKSVSISCKWCGRLVLPNIECAYDVCLNCYRLLSGAGISDGEIFADLAE